MEHVAWTEDPVACLTPEYLSVDPDLGSARDDVERLIFTGMAVIGRTCAGFY
jgi:hypothetical protein